MEDLSAFATEHPEFSDPKAVRVPGHGAVPSLEGARPFELTADALSAYRVDVPKDPATLPNMQDGRGGGRVLRELPPASRPVGHLCARRGPAGPEGGVPPDH